MSRAGWTDVKYCFILTWRDLESKLGKNYLGHLDSLGEAVKKFGGLRLNNALRPLRNTRTDEWLAGEARQRLTPHFVNFAKVLSEYFEMIFRNPCCICLLGHYRQTTLFDAWVPRRMWSVYWPPSPIEKATELLLIEPDFSEREEEFKKVLEYCEDGLWIAVRYCLSDIYGDFVNSLVRYDDDLLEKSRDIVAMLVRNNAAEDVKSEKVKAFLARVGRFMLKSNDIPSEAIKAWEERLNQLEEESTHQTSSTGFTELRRSSLRPNTSGSSSSPSTSFETPADWTSPKLTSWERKLDKFSDACRTYCRMKVLANTIFSAEFQELFSADMENTWQFLRSSRLWGTSSDATVGEHGKDYILLQFLIQLAKNLGQRPDSHMHPAEYRRMVLEKHLEVDRSQWEAEWPPSEEEKLVFDWETTSFERREAFFFEAIEEYKSKNWLKLREKLKEGSEYDYLVLRDHGGRYFMYVPFRRDILAARKKIWSDPEMKKDIESWLGMTANWLWTYNDEAPGTGLDYRKKTFEMIGIEETRWDQIWSPTDVRKCSSYA